MSPQPEYRVVIQMKSGRSLYTSATNPEKSGEYARQVVMDLAAAKSGETVLVHLADAGTVIDPRQVEYAYVETVTPPAPKPERIPRPVYSWWSKWAW